MKPGALMGTRPAARVISLATLCLTLSIVFVLPCAGAQYNLVHAFAGGTKDGASPSSFGASLIASGSTLYGVTTSGGTRTNGVLFKINSNSSGLLLVHSFNGYTVLDPSSSKNDGAFPVGTPLLSDSTLYGMTQMGGSNGIGTVFKVNTDGSGFQILHHFGNPNDGTAPSGSLILDGTNLYGMTQGGGSNSSDGTIFVVDTNGANYQVLHDFDANGGPLVPEGSLLLAGTTLYGMSSMGGPLGSGALFAMNTDGSGFTNLHNFTGVVTDGSHPYGSLIVSGSTLYGMTKDGGSNNVGTVFQINTNGGGFQILHNFSFSEGFNPYGDLTLLGSTLYGMTHSGGAGGIGLGVIFQINTDGSGYQILHSFLFPATATDGSFPFGSLLPLNSVLYGMTALGGSLTLDRGSIFSYNLSGGGGGGGGGGDSSAPSLTITTPTKNQQVTNQLITVAGTAKDNVGVTEVRIRLNDGPWLVTFSSNGYTNWFFPNLVVTPGANVISAWALDGSGNYSKTNSIQFTYLIVSPLSVQIVGQGTVSPNYNNQLLIIGESYKISAKAGKGFKFQYWSGGVPMTNNPKLTFTMQANLVIIANFKDTTRPVDAILVPKVNQAISNALFAVSGRASDNVGVSSVRVHLNDGPWTNAATGDSWTNWASPDFLVNSGPNVAQTYAVDAAGNISLTNSVKFTYKVLPISDWAPDSLNGLLAQLQPSNDSPFSIIFDSATFNQTGDVTNAENFGVGNYVYTKLATNLAALMMTDYGPLPQTNSTVAMFTFTNHYSGAYSNSDGTTGELALTIAANSVPATVIKKTIITKDVVTGDVAAVKLVDGTHFTQTSVTLGSGSGSYSFARYSPTGGLLTLNYTNAPVVQVELNFSSAKAGLYFSASPGTLGSPVTVSAGTFTFK